MPCLCSVVLMQLYTRLNTLLKPEKDTQVKFFLIFKNVTFCHKIIQSRNITQSLKSSKSCYRCQIGSKSIVTIVASLVLKNVLINVGR